MNNIGSGVFSLTLLMRKGAKLGLFTTLFYLCLDFKQVIFLRKTGNISKKKWPEKAQC